MENIIDATYKKKFLLIALTLIVLLIVDKRISRAEEKSSVCREGFKRTQERIWQGIEIFYESCEKPLYKAFVAKIEIKGVDYELITTPSKLIYSELSTFATSTNCIIATNGGFFGPEHGGWFMSFGKETGKFIDDENTSVVAFGKNVDGNIKVEIFPPEHVMPKGGGAPDWIFHGVTGMPLLVKEGKINTIYPPDDLVKFKKGEGDASTLNSLWVTRHPRTAIGISKDNSWMLLAVVDGRQKDWSRGMKIDELSHLIYDYGVWNALNLDGGCSSAMWVSTKNAVINSQCIQHGKVRKTAGHIGVVPLKKKVSKLSKLLSILFPSHFSIRI